MKVGKKRKLTEEGKNTEENGLESIKNQLARALADYDNLRKRTEAEKDIWFKVAGGRVISRFLSVLDNLENAQKHLNDSGLAIVINEFRRVIIDEGYEEVSIKIGETDFDSEAMEAVEVMETEDVKKVNKIADVVMTGWRAKDGDQVGSNVLRPAKVKVYKIK